MFIGDKAKIKDLKLNKKKLGNGAYEYYLTTVIEHEDIAGVYETVIPRIELPVQLRELKITGNHMPYPSMEIDLGFGLLEIWNQFGSAPYISTKIKDKTQKMTLAEIEKKLGYKIELVSEK